MRSVMVGCWRAAFLAFVCLCGADLSTIAIAAPPLSTYGSLPAFEMAAMSASGKRVAMIGTGASGMQAGPSIAPDVAHVLLRLLGAFLLGGVAAPLAFAGMEALDRTLGNIEVGET